MNAITVAFLDDKDYPLHPPEEEEWGSAVCVPAKGDKIFLNSLWYTVTGRMWSHSGFVTLKVER